LASSTRTYNVIELLREHGRRENGDLELLTPIVRRPFFCRKPLKTAISVAFIPESKKNIFL